MNLKSFPSREWALLLSLLLAGAPRAPAQQSLQDRVAGLLDNAAVKSNLRVRGIAPFQLKAQVRIQQAGSWLQGSYELLWKSESQWRERIELPGYQRTRIGGEGKYWQVRSLPFEALRIYELSRTIDLGPRLRLSPVEFAERMHERKWKGAQVECARTKLAASPHRELCFNSESLLVREEYWSSQPIGKTEITAREYSNFIAWGEKKFPGEMQAFAGGRVILEAKVESIQVLPEQSPAAFAPPAGGEVWASCENPTPHAQVSTTHPRYPALAKSQFVQGTVTVYAILGTNGKLSNLAIARSAGGLLDNAVLEALPNWQFQPMTCGGTPVREEIFVDVTFTIGR